MPKRDKYVKFKNYDMKIKSPFIIYTDFESILMSKNNEKQKSLIWTNIKNVWLPNMAINDVACNNKKI